MRREGFVKSTANTMLQLNITETERRGLEELITDIKKDWPFATFKLFGSKAKGIADEESDLDLLILLPCFVTDEIRREIVHRVFNINLNYGTNISVIIVSEEEWAKAQYCSA